MTLTEFQKEAKKLDLVFFTREEWEGMKEGICDTLCRVPYGYDEDTVAEICEGCPLVRRKEDKT